MTLKSPAEILLLLFQRPETGFSIAVTLHFQCKYVYISMLCRHSSKHIIMQLCVAVGVEMIQMQAKAQKRTKASSP